MIYIYIYIYCVSFSDSSEGPMRPSSRLYSLRFMTAKVQSKSNRRKICINGVKRELTQASNVLPCLRSHRSALSLTVDYGLICELSLPLEAL